MKSANQLGKGQLCVPLNYKMREQIDYNEQQVLVENWIVATYRYLENITLVHEHGCSVGTSSGLHDFT